MEEEQHHRLRFDDEHVMCIGVCCVSAMSHLARNLGRFEMACEALPNHPDSIIHLRGIVEDIEACIMA